MILFPHTSTAYLSTASDAFPMTLPINGTAETEWRQGRNPVRHFIGTAPIMAALTLIAMTPLIDVFGASVWWGVAGAAVWCACIVMLPGCFNASMRFWQLPCCLLMQLVVAPLCVLPDTIEHHPAPSVATITEGLWSAITCWKTIIAVDPPLDSFEGTSMAIWMLAFWALICTIRLALSDGTASRCCAIIPIAVSFILSALLGSEQQPYSAVVLLVPLMFTLWLSRSLRIPESARWPSTLFIIALIIPMVLATPQTVSDRMLLRSSYTPPLQALEHTSPLTLLRTYIERHGQQRMLTVTGLPDDAPIRLAVMDHFDGEVWNIGNPKDQTAQHQQTWHRLGGSQSTSARQQADANNANANTDASNTSRAADNADTVTTSTLDQCDGNANRSEPCTFRAKFRIDHRSDDIWLPTAGVVTSVSMHQPDTAKSLYVHGGSSSLALMQGKKAGLTYTVTGTLPRSNDSQPRLVSSARANTIPQSEPQHVPDAVREYALAFTSGLQNEGAKAERIAEQLRTHGWFSHGLEGDYPSPAGHGAYRISQMLTEGNAMVGDSEQYASLMALMARSLGMPARVVLGFPPKTADHTSGDATGKSPSDTISNLQHSTRSLTGSDMQSWVEISLQDLGWVPFYPTPPASKQPDSRQDLTIPEAKSLVQQPPTPLTQPPQTHQSPHAPSGQQSSETPQTPNNSDHSLSLFLGILQRTTPLWIPLSVIAMLTLPRAWIVRHRRLHGSPAQRMLYGWQHLHAVARQAGLNPTGTRRLQASYLSRHTSIPVDTLNRLARKADQAAFSATPPTDDQVREYWHTVRDIERSIRASQPPIRRWMMRYSPRGLSDYCSFMSLRTLTARILTIFITSRRRGRRKGGNHGQYACAVGDAE